MLDHVVLLGHDLPSRVVALMFVLTGIRVDMVRFGRGEYDNNMPGAGPDRSVGEQRWKRPVHLYLEHAKPDDSGHAAAADITRRPRLALPTFDIGGDYAYVSPAKNSDDGTEIFRVPTHRSVGMIAATEDLLGLTSRMDAFLRSATNLASADASTADFLTAAQAVHALEGRLGRVYTRQRLGIERDNEAHALRRGLRITNVIIEGILRTSGTYWLGHGNAAKVRMCHNEVWSARLPAAFDGLIILHLSDLHADMSQRAMVEAARLVRDLNYDLCVLTGDYRGKTFGPFQPCLRHMLPLVEALKGDVYGVLGNHDSVLMVPDLERLGIRMLLNEHVVIERDGETLFLAGIDDALFYRVDNIEKVSADMHRHAFSILLSHTPEIYRQASHAGYELMLAGHTHGGQICLPGRTPIILHSKLPRSMGSGAWKYHDMAGYTSVGAGACGVPVRFNCPPEITLHRLRRVYWPERTKRPDLTGETV